MKRPKRKKIRLENYDYSLNGAYFITICTRNNQLFFREKESRYKPFDIYPVGATSGRPYNISCN